MAITKKDGLELARYINDVIVWGTGVSSGVNKIDSSVVTQYMIWHNESGRKINSMLKTNAIHLYVKQNGEEY